VFDLRTNIVKHAAEKWAALPLTGDKQARQSIFKSQFDVATWSRAHTKVQPGQSIKQNSVEKHF
jgi:hypothetical protein